MSTKLLLGWVLLRCLLLCLELGQGAPGHGEDSGSGVEVWIGELRGLRVKTKKKKKWGKFLGSDWRIWVQMSGGGSAEVIEDPAIKVQASVVEERPNYHQGFLWCANTKKKRRRRRKNPSSHLEIPVFTLCDVYKYSWKREMTCLCNIPSDLQSDAIAEPKTKARVIFLTNVNRRCTREFTVEHWNKMWGSLDCVCWVSPLRVGKEVLIRLPRRGL